MLTLVEDRYTADEKAEGLVGGGGTQYYRFQALKEGNTEITLTYQRPCEGTFAQRKVFRINIRSSSTPSD